MSKRILPHPKTDDPSTDVPYVDDKRDARDCFLLCAVQGAIQLIADEEPDQAAAVLRLIRSNLEASWPATGDKFTAEVAHHV